MYGNNRKVLGGFLLVFGFASLELFVTHLSDDSLIIMALRIGAIFPTVILALGFYGSRQKGHPLFLRMIAAFAFMGLMLNASRYLGDAIAILGVAVSIGICLIGFKGSIMQMRQDAENGTPRDHFQKPD